MKRLLVKDDEFCKLKKKALLFRNSVVDENHCSCYLDLSLSSKLLSSKLSDVPHKLKYETIMKPLFEYCFGTSNDEVWEDFTVRERNMWGIICDYDDSYSEEEYESYGEILNKTANDSRIELIIDWKRDETFIYDQIFNLPFEKLKVLADLFGLWKNRLFVLQSIECYNVNYEIMDDCMDGMLRKDRELLMKIVKEDGTNLMYDIFNEWRNDYEIVKTAVQVSGEALEYASEELRNDLEIVKIAVKQSGYAFDYASEELKNNKEIILISLESSPTPYRFISDEMKLDMDIMSLAFSKDNNNVFEVKYLIVMDRERLMIAAKYEGKMAMQYASEEIRNDREFALQCLQTKVSSLQFAPDELRNDRELIIQQIQKDPFAFIYASDGLKKDREIVKILAMKDTVVILYAEDEFREDEEIASLLLKNSSYAFRFISNRLKTDNEFISKSIANRGYYSLPQSLIFNRELFLKSIKLDSHNFISIPTDLKSDREFMLECVEINGAVFTFLPEELRKDREIVLAAVTRNGNLILQTEQFFHDEEIIIKASETYQESHIGSINSFNFYHQISEELKGNREFNLKLAKGNAYPFFCKFPRKLQLDKDIMKATLENKDNAKTFLENLQNWSNKPLDRVLAIQIVKANGLMLEKMRFKHRNDREIVSFAVKQNKSAFKFASEELQNDPTILNKS